MSKIKLLLDVVQDVRALADSLQAVADFIQLGTASPEETPAQPVDSTPPKHTKPQITIDQVRTLLAEKSGEGKTQAVKALLYKYDAGKLSGVKPEDSLRPCFGLDLGRQPDESLAIVGGTAYQRWELLASIIRSCKYKNYKLLVFMAEFSDLMSDFAPDIRRMCQETPGAELLETLEEWCAKLDELGNIIDERRNASSLTKQAIEQGVNSPLWAESYNHFKHGVERNDCAPCFQREELVRSACHALAQQTRNGWGTPVDIDASYRWCVRAAELGHEDAKRDLLRYHKKLFGGYAFK